MKHSWVLIFAAPLMGQSINEVTSQRAIILAQQAAAAAAAAAAATRAQNEALLITQLFGFLAILSGFLYNAWVKTRERRWAQEDARAAAGELKKRDLATQAHREDVMLKLDTVAGKADAAYKEANTVNQKIASIGVEMKDGKSLSPVEGKP